MRSPRVSPSANRRAREGSDEIQSRLMVMESQGRPLGWATWSPEAGDSEALISAARNDGFWLDTGVTSHSYSEN